MTAWIRFCASRPGLRHVRVDAGIRRRLVVVHAMLAPEPVLLVHEPLDTVDDGLFVHVAELSQRLTRRGIGLRRSPSTAARPVLGAVETGSRIGQGMGKTWVLDTETKGTGANVVPLEKLQKEADAQARPRPAKGTRARSVPEARQASERTRARTSGKPTHRTVTALPPGHVRKKATGEIGKVRSVDPKAGTAVVHWLKRGDVSTVALSAISRR